MCGHGASSFGNICLLQLAVGDRVCGEGMTGSTVGEVVWSQIVKCMLFPVKQCGP